MIFPFFLFLSIFAKVTHIYGVPVTASVSAFILVQRLHGLALGSQHYLEWRQCIENSKFVCPSILLQWMFEKNVFKN